MDSGILQNVTLSYHRCCNRGAILTSLSTWSAKTNRADSHDSITTAIAPRDTASGAYNLMIAQTGPREKSVLA